RDYDAAVMVGGFIGFAMGATSNAMANMQAVTRRYGAAPAAFFVIPMVGSLFIDFVNSAVVTLLIPWLGSFA
ncbi:MAG: sodium:glutamate symporter, partial [Oscillibacter sp.]|nr:sodium:glutamate symporter [Oscillibacter sp.]